MIPDRREILGRQKPFTQSVVRFAVRCQFELLIIKFHLPFKNIFKKLLDRINKELFHILGRFRFTDLLPEIG
jgi:hypothetical protein